MANPETGTDTMRPTFGEDRAMPGQRLSYTSTVDSSKNLRIVEESEQLSAMIEELVRTTDDLLDRIEPVLEPRSEKRPGESDETQTRSSGSSVAEYLCQQTEELRRLLYRVTEARSRLEL